MTHRRLSEASMGYIAKTLAQFSENGTTGAVPQTPTAKFLCVRFEVQGVRPGTAVAVLGSSAMLGMWDYGHMVALSPKPGSPIWNTTDVVIPVLTSQFSLEYKYVLIDSVAFT